MDNFLIVLLLLAIIGLSNVINHLVPYIPVPLIQIALGVVIAVLPFGIHVPMESELFLVLFIAPLLFNDGRNTSRIALWKLRTPILLLALGLVFVTVFVIGFFIHWLIPTIPLPASFALAALLSPTDAVAVSAMSSRVKMPRIIMHILEGEGLMNDASGLVAFNFAITAMVTGAFSLVNASISFLIIAIGGFVGGAFLAFIIIRIRVLLRSLGMEDVTIHMLIQILTPFVIYLLIEHIHLSGILAVVAAGIVHAIERDREKSPTVELQVVSKSTWTVILYVLNGLVFVLLGLQIPSVATTIFKDPLFNNFVVIKYIIIITTALLFLRFVWVLLSGWMGVKIKKQKADWFKLRHAGITTIAGVRGAVTLAGAFSIPYVLSDGGPFPERSLIIFIAAGVILLTLIIASIFLPLMAKPDGGNIALEREKMEKAAMIQMKIAAIRETRKVMNEDNRTAALSIISSYNQRIIELQSGIGGRDSLDFKKVEKLTRLQALEAESQYVGKIVKRKEVDRETAYKLQEHIHRMEIAITNQQRFRALIIWNMLRRASIRFLQFFSPKKVEIRRQHRKKFRKIAELKIDMAKAAIQFLIKNMTLENRDISYAVIGEYNQLIQKLEGARNNKDSRMDERFERELKDKAFQAERDEIQNMFEQGEIPIDLVRKLRRQINMREVYWMEGNSI
ncbi:Na+/H+ antiporter [Heyndrickxia camelliae]|uniref:Na+/H+ antiporter n=1 Tax=Heyndrickxia camelliae TaxID=1707093 RepID=A0A2N3LKY0_9BACI|nr:Na+/H+ antiporter [Heyndrickxia camelliae]PKR85302.1 Na+/H+ antiporter [Heyndrickxia camelliae]